MISGGQDELGENKEASRTQGDLKKWAVGEVSFNVFTPSVALPSAVPVIQANYSLSDLHDLHRGSGLGWDQVDCSHRR
jgi:hypothetical protein